MKTSPEYFHQPEFSPPPYGSGRSVKLSYCEFMQKNKPQSNSVAGGLLILSASGFHIAWLLWNIFKSQPNAALFFQFASWYFGAIIGSILARILITSWQKKSIYYCSGLISSVGSIFFIVWYENVYLITIGRLIAGIAHGIVYVTVITHGAENVIKEMRGRLISTIQFLIYSSAFTFTVVMTYSYPSMYQSLIQTEQMLGILALVFALMGLVFTPCFTYESVIFLLHRNDERQALENMIKLRSESNVTWNISNDLQEMKLMVAEDREKNGNILKDYNLRPLMLMLALNLITVLSSNLILNRKLIELTSESILNNNNETSMAIAAMILVTTRYIAGIVMVIFGDIINRKKCLVLTAGLSGTCLLLLHILSEYIPSASHGVNYIPGILAITFQIFVGVGVEPIQYVLISEAFSTVKKNGSIAFIIAFESIIQIGIIGLSFLDTNLLTQLFIYFTIVCITLVTIHLHLKLPETRGMSLRQARDEFVNGGRAEGITYS